jgi:hypothetical protein
LDELVVGAAGHHPKEAVHAGDQIALSDGRHAIGV